MCLILDTNKYGNFLNQDNPDMEPVRKWLEKGGKIAYSPTQEMERELEGHEGMKDWFKARRRTPRVKYIPKNKVEQAMKKLLQSSNLRSNDHHIIALAQVSGVKLLISSDRKLHADFTNKDIVGGSIYQNKKHQHLLKPDLCP